MEMILLDWTRMGVNYCVAGAVLGKDGCRIVRPLVVGNRQERVRKFGWAGHQLRGRSRWEILELAGWEEAEPQPPHLEDGWARSLRPTGRSATPDVRRAVLAATAAQAVEWLFGAPLQTTRTAAFLPAGAGSRSLVTVTVPMERIAFGGSWRNLHADLRVELPLPEVGRRWLPIKDHPLLARTQPADLNDLDGHIAALTSAVRAMGPSVAVRLGLSRAFEHTDATTPPVCWLMADGFFSAADPQP
jgi:hypothetical protein